MKQQKILVAIPAYNEEDILEKNVLRLYSFLKNNKSINQKKHNWKIVISNNASQDKTLDIARKLSGKYKEIDFVSQKSRPKSLSIKNTFLLKKYDDYDIYFYMDADLSTDIKHFPQLIQGI